MRVFNFLKHSIAVTAVLAATSAYAVEQGELTYTISPDPIGVDDVENIQIMPAINGEWPNCDSYYISQYFKGGGCEVNNELGVKYTDVYFRITQDDDFNNYYLLAFEKAPVEGSYTIVIPAGYFYTVDFNSGDHLTECYATTINFTVGEKGDIPEPTGFEPKSIYPESGDVIDSSFLEWTFYVTWNEAVTINEGVIPYVICDDVTTPASSVMSMEGFKMPQQTNIEFDGVKEFPNGTYVLVIPEGFCSYSNGETNRTWSAKFIWEGGKREQGDQGDVQIKAASIGGISIMEDGVVLPNIAPEGVNIVIDVTPEDIQGVIYTLLDVTGLEPESYSLAEAIFCNTAESKAGTVFTKEIYSIEGYKLYEGHDYVVMFEPCYQLYPNVKAATLYSAVFTGETEAYRYSNVSVVSIKPEPGSTFEVGDEMVVTFSAPVTLIAGDGESGFGHGNAGWSNFASMAPNSDKTVWTIRFQNSDITSAAGPGQIDPHIAGVDAQGLRIRPAEFPDEPGEGILVWNFGTEGRSYFSVSYDGYAKCPKVVVSPLETKTLSYIDFTIEGNKEIGLSYMAAFPEIKNETGEVVAIVLTDEYDTDSEGTPNPNGHVTVTKFSGETDGKNLELRAKLNNEITKPGTYTLELPWNLFTVGREQSAYPSAPGSFVITIDGTTDVETIETENTAAEYFTVDGVKVQNPVKGLYIKVSNGKAVKVIL